MSVIDKKYPERFDTPKDKFALNIEDLSNFTYDMQHCIKCKGCYWVKITTYMPGDEARSALSQQSLEGIRLLRSFRKDENRSENQ